MAAFYGRPLDCQRLAAGVENNGLAVSSRKCIPSAELGGGVTAWRRQYRPWRLGSCSASSRRLLIRHGGNRYINGLLFNDEPAAMSRRRRVWRSIDIGGAGGIWLA